MMEPDASAFGAAIIAAIGSGAYEQSDFDSFIQPQTIFEPDMTSKQKYDNLFASYKALYGQLRDTFAYLYVCANG